MNFFLMPSLEHRVLVKIVIALWSRDDLRDRILKSLLSEDEWQGIEYSVAEKVADLPISEKLKERMFTIIEPVGLRIRRWIKEHDILILPSVIQKFQTMMIWTSHGTIDKKRTAEVFVMDETLGPYNRFELAGHYCLEDHIRDVWEKYNPRDFEPKVWFQRNVLTTFWFNYFKEKGEIPSVHTFENDFETYRGLFQYSACNGNEVATRYLCSKLSFQSTEEIRMETVMKLAELGCKYTQSESISDVLFFLLSTMNSDQQAEVLERKSYGVLNSLLSWPWRSLFLETAKRLVCFLSDLQYDYLSHKIVDRLRKHNNIKELFGEFYQQTQKSWQTFIREKSNLGSILLKLYKRNGKTIIKCILGDFYNSAREIGEQDHLREGIVVTRFDSSGVTLRRFDGIETEFKWVENEILQLIEYCYYA